MRTIEHDELIFTEIEVPPYCSRCKRAGEAILRATNGEAALDRDGAPDMKDGKVFRPLRLTIDGGAGLVVAQVYIGEQSCFAGDCGITADVFAEGVVDVGAAFPTLAPFVAAQIVLRNPGDEPVRVRAKFTGPSVLYGADAS